MNYRESFMIAVGGVCGGVLGSLMTRQLIVILGPKWGGFAALAIIPITLGLAYWLVRRMDQ